MFTQQRSLLVIVFSLIGALIFFACEKDYAPIGPSGFDPNLAKQLQTSLDNAVKECKVPGAVMAVRVPDGSTWIGASGVANREDGTPMTMDTHLRIGSVTKTYTATVVLQLVDEGLLKLEDTIEKILPGICVNSDKITIRQLLSHHSGLAQWTNNPAWWQVMMTDPQHVWTPEELVSYCDSAVFEPGERYDYNNVNYTLLAMIIEKVAGKTFQEEVTSCIIEPLGLKQTQVHTRIDMPEPYAHGYRIENGAVQDWTFLFGNFSLYYAQGEMISTAEDQLVWIDALASGKLLSKETQAERMKFQPTDDPDETYGLGIENRKGAIGHLGTVYWFYTADVCRYKNYDFVILTNGMDEGGSEDKSHAYFIFWKVVEDVGL